MTMAVRTQSHANWREVLRERGPIQGSHPTDVPSPNKSRYAPRSAAASPPPRSPLPLPFSWSGSVAASVSMGSPVLMSTGSAASVSVSDSVAAREVSSSVMSSALSRRSVRSCNRMCRLTWGFSPPSMGRLLEARYRSRMCPKASARRRAGLRSSWVPSAAGRGSVNGESAVSSFSPVIASKSIFATRRPLRVFEAKSSLRSVSSGGGLLPP
ncbi:unannotated protein [freshwater metagenome]|uniref:Unannotated protein n=1 Tax=freshwater metagenome TaxID=449393 RepID=A0A6J7E6W5_9ZZZZ